MSTKRKRPTVSGENNRRVLCITRENTYDAHQEKIEIKVVIQNGIERNILVGCEARRADAAKACKAGIRSFCGNDACDKCFGKSIASYTYITQNHAKNKKNKNPEVPFPQLLLHTNKHVLYLKCPTCKHPFKSSASIPC